MVILKQWLKTSPKTSKTARPAPGIRKESKMAKKPIFLTDGMGGIFKFVRAVKSAVLLNLETNETVTSEIIGSNITGFAYINMPTATDIAGKTETAVKKTRKMRKDSVKKSSHYFGVSLCNSKKNPYRATLWLGGKNVGLGGYPTEEAAARAADDRLEKEGRPRKNFP